jgi:hypothetical protein
MTRFESSPHAFGPETVAPENVQGDFQDWFTERFGEFATTYGTQGPDDPATRNAANELKNGIFAWCGQNVSDNPRTDFFEKGDYAGLPAYLGSKWGGREFTIFRYGRIFINNQDAGAYLELTSYRGPQRADKSIQYRIRASGAIFEVEEDRRGLPAREFKMPNPGSREQ